MKKELVILAATSLVFVSPVFASRDNDHRNDDVNRTNPVIDNAVVAASPADSASPSVSPSASASATPSPSCNPADNWFNHGAYVSCVAHLHQGGRVTSAAAHSEIGKRDEDQDQNEDDQGEDENEHHSPRPTVSPTASPSVSPSASPNASPSESPTASPSATPPITSGVISPNLFSMDLSGATRLLISVEQFLQSLLHLG